MIAVIRYRRSTGVRNTQKAHKVCGQCGGNFDEAPAVWRRLNRCTANFGTAIVFDVVRAGLKYKFWSRLASALAEKRAGDAVTSRDPEFPRGASDDLEYRAHRASRGDQLVRHGLRIFRNAHHTSVGGDENHVE